MTDRPTYGTGHRISLDKLYTGIFEEMYAYIFQQH